MLRVGLGLPVLSAAVAMAAPPAARIVLVGGGHAHAQALRALNYAARPKDLEVTLIDPQGAASYSGMVPACVAGFYDDKETRLALGPLTAWAGIEFKQTRVIDLDPEARTIHTEDGGSVPYDVLSLDIGSATRGLDDIPGARQHSIPTRPISELIHRIAATEQDAGFTDKSATVAIVGAGAAGIELAFAISARWSRFFTPEKAAEAGNGQQAGGEGRADGVLDHQGRHGEGLVERPLRVILLDAGTEILPHETPECRHAVVAKLAERGIEVRHGCKVARVEVNAVLLEDGREVPCTHCVWATGAAAHPLADRLRASGIAMTDDGWIRVAPTMRSVSHPSIFAAGDCCHIEDPSGSPAPPKAGVYAVRTGPVLIQNLPEAALAQREGREPRLVPYEPQREFLKLLMCGDGTAIGFRFGKALQGPWVWQLKDHIDRSFMAIFAPENLPDLAPGVALDTSQYDAVDELPPRLDPAEAAALLRRSDPDVDYMRAWVCLRQMMADEGYRDQVLAAM